MPFESQSFLLMYHFYVIQSLGTGRKYKGHTENLDARLLQHNSGKCKSTRNEAPWAFLYSEPYETRQEAITREKYFKTLAGGKSLNRILEEQ